jgi:basic membrane lipoprotein Med (substrate-binding protein (PBP1-ABC) superfamily)
MVAGQDDLLPNLRLVCAAQLSAGYRERAEVFGRRPELAAGSIGSDIGFAAALGLGWKDVLVVGSNADQNAVAPEVTVGSVVIDLPRAFMLVARDVQAKRFEGKVYRLGGKEQVVTLVLNPARKDLVTPALQAALDSARTGLESGALKVQ